VHEPAFTTPPKAESAQPRQVTIPNSHAQRTKRGPESNEIKAARRQEFMAPFLEKQTLAAIAIGSGVIHSSLHRWHNGLQHLSRENQNKLASYLKVSKIPD